MREYIDVEKAQAELYDKTTQAIAAQLPPGYFMGFRLQRNDQNQLIIGKGICDIRGKRVQLSDDYIITGSDYVVPDSIIKLVPWFVYIDSNGTVKVDTLQASYDSKYYGFYHPVLSQFRYIGTFTIHSDGTYFNIYSHDPLEVGALSAAYIQTLLLQAASVIIGYGGTGISTSSQEGDRRIYIDEDEIGVEEYTNGGWTTVSGIKIGGAIAGLFLNLIGCGGIYNPNAVLGSQEFLPQPSFRVFNFDGNYEDHLGVDDWSAKTYLALSSDPVKFGTQSLTAQADTLGTLLGASVGTLGESQAAGAWVYIEEILAGTEDKYAQLFYFIADTVGSIDGIRVDAYYNSEKKWHIRFRAIKDSITVFTYVFNDEMPLDSWIYIGFAYNSISDILTCIFNNKSYTSEALGGEWATPDTIHLSSVLRNNQGLADGGPTVSIYIDELLFYYDKTLDPDFLVQHYNHDIPWNTDYSRLDLLLIPASDGAIHSIGDHKIAGNAEITGKLSIDSPASDFYNPSGDVSAGIFKWLASPYYLVRDEYDPSSTDVITENVVDGDPIPSGAKAVYTLVKFFSNNSTPPILYFHDAASGGEEIVSLKGSANGTIGHNIILPVDSSGNIYWQPSSTDVDNVTIKILGYWI